MLLLSDVGYVLSDYFSGSWGGHCAPRCVVWCLSSLVGGAHRAPSLFSSHRCISVRSTASLFFDYCVIVSLRPMCVVGASRHCVTWCRAQILDGAWSMVWQDRQAEPAGGKEPARAMVWRGAGRWARPARQQDACRQHRRPAAATAAAAAAASLAGRELGVDERGEVQQHRLVHATPRAPEAYTRPQFGSTEAPIVGYTGWFRCVSDIKRPRLR